jgi:hypothetical protein
MICLRNIRTNTLHNRDSDDDDDDNNNNNVSHLFYMNGLKLFSKDKTELQQELIMGKAFSDYINGVWPRQMCHSMTS